MIWKQRCQKCFRFSVVASQLELKKSCREFWDI